MADDKMELCPARYGEDFDFDFDLTAPLEDEDTIIEDLISTGYSVTSQASYSLINDNNDNESIKESNETETRTDFKYRKSDDESISPRNIDGANLKFIQKTPEPTSDQTYQENVWPSHPEDSTSEAVENDMTRQEVWHNEEKFAADSKNAHKQESQISLHYDDGLENDFPAQQFKGAFKAPSSHFFNAGEVSESTERNENYLKAGSLVPSSPLDSPTFFSRSETSGENSDLSDVIVVYQSNEYLLFSTSELDDPNTFFIKDRTIAQKPLCDFFWAIRNVIHEDLEYENELWLFFPEFGLQIEETSSLLQNVTFQELVFLRKKLLLNDGIDIIQPMYIDLGIRQNFEKELMRITKNANDGKGLSESVFWNESNEDQKGSIINEDGSPSTFENQSIHDKSTIDEQLEENDSRYEAEHVNQTDLEEKKEYTKIPETDSRYELEQHYELQNKSGFLVTGKIIASRNCHDSGPTQAFQNESISHARPKIHGPVSNSFYDAESDIIDYSEDDLEDRKNLISKTASVINDCKTKPPRKDKTTSRNMNSIFGEGNMNIKTGEEINIQDLEPHIDDQKNRNQENDTESPSEPIADLKVHIDMQSDKNEVNYHHGSAEIDAMSEQIDQDKRQSVQTQVNTTKDTGRMKENMTYLNNRNFPIRDKPNISHKSKVNRIEASTTLDFIEASTVNPKTFSDRRFENLMVDPLQEHIIQDINSLDKLGNEDENEINYEEDEDNDDGANKKDTLPQSIRQPINKFPPSTIGKRSRIDFKHEATLEKRDRKRYRS